MILLVTSKSDLTSDYLIDRLNERGVAFYRLNTEDLLTTLDISMELGDGQASFTLFDRLLTSKVRSSEVTGAYFRRPEEPTCIEVPDCDEARFCRRELVESLRSLWRTLPQEVWLNTPEALWSATNKIKQLSVAAAVGFAIPRTLVSSRTTDILRFVEAVGGNAVAKTLRHGYSGSEDEISVILTSEIGEADIAHLKNVERTLPMILQPRIPKLLDLRITIVGQQIFAAGLHSQENEATSVDWRFADLDDAIELQYESLELPRDVKHKCLALNRRLGLNFSCMDFILTPTGEYVFLEANPNGQWGWLEEMLDFPIRDAIIDELEVRREVLACLKS